ncbi:CAP domain-containing protein [Fluviibacterium sp. DFM31]|uniref:CAP domain-containing protein n=1 Tax=Meridianimarinicoccus marinus TaxID=3231483 RepID=A0ABV3L891_9RHOB
MTVDIYAPTPGDALSSAELEFYHLVNDYRISLGLDAIQLSQSLTTVAGRHAQDVLYNIWEPNLQQPANASLNSWSDAVYFNDHSNTGVMHDAPQRLGTAYVDPNATPTTRLDRGYELSVAGPATVQEAFNAFLASDPHHNVIINNATWATFDFNAIGFGVEQDPSITTNGGTIYHIWFGEMADPAGAPDINGDGSDNSLRGTLFDDVLDGLAGNDTILGDDGDDIIRAGTGNDVFNGGNGADTLIEDLSGAAAQQFVVQVNLNTGDHGAKGDAANRDTLIAMENYTLIGDYDAEVMGNGAANVVTTDAGDDTISVGAGDDTVNAGDGNDTIDGGGGSDQLFGQAGDDHLTGGFANDFLFGGSGNDTLLGGDSNDQLFGGSGIDTMDGGNGSDFYVIDAFDLVMDTGTTGYDKAQINDAGGVSVLMTLAGWGGIERVNGFTGNDTVDASEQTSTVLLFGDAGDDMLTGGSGNDVLIGGDGNDTLTGNDGNDIMLGAAGNDTFNGGAGNDVFYIGESGDVVSDGGAGFDKAVIYDTNGLTLNVGSWVGVERIMGLTGDDTIDATGMTTSVTLVGGAGKDVLTGGSDADVFFGGADDDTLLGAAGNDALIAGAGNDMLDGGAGNDFLFGGAGIDAFVWTDGFGKDVVKDFTDGIDRLDFAGHSTVNSTSDLVITQSGQHTIISLAAGGTDQITLANTQASLITGSDFDFV